MIIGSGLLAKAMAPHFEADPSVCIYAAGVSNSNCVMDSEFEREKARLMASLERLSEVNCFVQFSTCSVEDQTARTSPYVQHRLAMESLARKHPQHLIVRLPQVAGNSPNPHTLLNYLYARISRSEGFSIWKGARRNIIDVDDIARIVRELVRRPEFRATTVNVANPEDHSVMDIVRIMEEIVGKPAVLDLKSRYSAYSINIDPIRSVIKDAGVVFSGDYLKKTLNKYYGKR